MRLLKIYSLYFFLIRKLKGEFFLKTSKLEKHINLLLYIYQHPRCELKSAERELGIMYDTLYKAVEQYVKESKVVKTRKAEIILGGTKLEYSLTEEGVAFLFRLKETLNKKLKNNA